MLFKTCIAVALVVHALPLQQRDLTPDPVAFGATHEVKPYALWEGKRLNGFVYTPFIRVAMAARAAAKRGTTLDASTLATLLSDPSVYVVMRWSSEDEQRARGDAPNTKPVVRVGITPEHYPLVKPWLVEPLWFTRDLSVLERFGAPSPFSDSAVVAAFPREALKPGSWIMAYVNVPEGPLQIGQHTPMRGAPITEKDLAVWR